MHLSKRKKPVVLIEWLKYNGWVLLGDLAFLYNVIYGLKTGEVCELIGFVKRSDDAPRYWVAIVISASLFIIGFLLLVTNANK